MIQEIENPVGHAIAEELRASLLKLLEETADKLARMDTPILVCAFGPVELGLDGLKFGILHVRGGATKRCDLRTPLVAGNKFIGGAMDVLDELY